MYILDIEESEDKSADVGILHADGRVIADYPVPTRCEDHVLRRNVPLSSFHTPHAISRLPVLH